MSRDGRVESIWRFPIKSFQGESIDVTHLSESGILGDRAFALRESSTGKVLSGKHAKLGEALLAFSARYEAEPVSGQHSGILKTLTYPALTIGRLIQPRHALFWHCVRTAHFVINTTEIPMERSTLGMEHCLTGTNACWRCATQVRCKLRQKGCVQPTFQRISAY